MTSLSVASSKTMRAPRASISHGGKIVNHNFLKDQPIRRQKKHVSPSITVSQLQLFTFETNYF